ncbi:hypothetical protein N7486_009475 [Penicillium sp. IBT 16267x]|nr:hypothetical protein N7486_009475 [Penicillium sp. IBT 16267x]
MDPTDSADGHPLTLDWSTPDNEEDFIASLFPHPLSRQRVQTPSIGSPIATNPHLRSEEDRSLFNHYIHMVSRAGAELNYPTQEKELLAIKHALRLWDRVIDNGHKTTVITDHASLQYLQTTTTYSW